MPNDDALVVRAFGLQVIDIEAWLRNLPNVAFDNYAKSLKSTQHIDRVVALTTTHIAEVRDLEVAMKDKQARANAATDWITELVSVALRRYPKSEWTTVVRLEDRRRGRNVMED